MDLGRIPLYNIPLSKTLVEAPQALHKNVSPYVGGKFSPKKIAPCSCVSGMPYSPGRGHVPMVSGM